MRNFYARDGREYTPLDAARHAREAVSLPDGRPIPQHLKHTLLALATYWPEIRPTLESLVRDTGLSRQTVTDHLRELADLDLVRTHREGRTAYRMLQLDRLIVGEPKRRPSPVTHLKAVAA